MVKSRAQIQREYRQRLKEKNNEAYLQKERERRKQNYVPSSQLSQRKRRQRNEYNRDYLKHYRARKKEVLELIHANNQQIEPSTSGYESGTSSVIPTENRLLVQMRFQKKANGPKMRISKELTKIKAEMKSLQAKHENLKRKYRTTARSLQRVKRKKTDKNTSTPRSKTEQQLDEMNLSAEQRSSVRKELLFANTICNEIKSAGEGTSTQARMRTRIVRNIVSGKTMKKYRMIKTLAQRIGLSRNKLAKVATKDINIKRFYRIREMGKYRYNVTRFLQRDENSRVMPGKADYVKTDAKKVQKRILTDYLSNLYHKFMMEHPTVKLSFTTFTRLRPKNILLTSFIRRDTCLCTKHQNMSFTLKAVKRLGIDVSLNAEKEVEKQEKIIQDMKNTEASDVVFSQWKRVKVEEKGRTKMTMKVVDSTVDKSGFIAHFEKQMNEFKDHVTRIQTQYAQMKELKINLPKNHCIVHMDFAENYQCKSVEEIQSAYWNQTSVTIHPVVVYYEVDEDELLHKSIVVISDEMGHNSATVLSIIDLIIPEIKQLLPTVECIHYWTDSPTSQYRNKAIFNAIANHSLDYGIRAKWNYWEAGHGKGPCDGIGGTSKRMADEAVRTGKVAIQDPHDFFAWTQSQSCSLKSIKFIFLPKDKCENKSKLLSEQKLRPVPGTMKLHAVAEKGNDVVAVRNTSCYCVTCLSDEFTCENWQLETVLKTGTQEGETAEVADEARETYPEMDYSIADYVAAIYLNKWYIGQIKTIDIEDNTIEISFLEKKKAMFQWPSRSDIIWVDRKDILCKISNPQPSGKSKRMLKVNPDDAAKIEKLYSNKN